MNVCVCVYTCMQMSVNLCVCVCVRACVCVFLWTCKRKYVDAFNAHKICVENTEFPFLSNTQATSAKKAPRILRVKAPSACCNEDQAS